MVKRKNTLPCSNKYNTVKWVFTVSRNSTVMWRGFHYAHYKIKSASFGVARSAWINGKITKTTASEKVIRKAATGKHRLVRLNLSCFWKHASDSSFFHFSSFHHKAPHLIRILKFPNQPLGALFFYHSSAPVGLVIRPIYGTSVFVFVVMITLHFYLFIETFSKSDSKNAPHFVFVFIKRSVPPLRWQHNQLPPSASLFAYCYFYIEFNFSFNLISLLA